jgi:hypothetical protein
LPVNLLFSIFLVLSVAYVYHAVNVLAINLGWVPQGFVFIGAEPIGYGLLFLLCESLLILVKNTFVNIYKKARG